MLVSNMRMSSPKHGPCNIELNKAHMNVHNHKQYQLRQHIITMATLSYSYLKLSGIQNPQQISCDPIVQILVNILGDILGQLATYPNSANLMASNSEG